MACPIRQEDIKQLELFIGLCKQNPSILQLKELEFFRSYITSLGGTIPAAPSFKQNEGDSTPVPPPPSNEVDSSPDVSDEESVVDLDMTGVISPDDDAHESMGVDSTEVTEEAIDASNEKKRAAIDHFGAGNFEEAIKAYTEAILLNPTSAILYAKRGQTFLKLNKPNACVRDCDKAVELNPDCAVAYKFRGRARRLLGDFLRAAEDLRCACKLDFDEQTDEWLKEVTPNARKLEEHARKYERLRLEKKIRQRTKAAQKARNSRAQQGQTHESKPDPSGMPIPPEFMKLLEDPEIMASLQDPEIAAAFQDITSNPAKLFQYQSNPKIAKFLTKASQLLAGKMGGSMPGFSGFPGFGAPPSGGSTGAPGSGPFPPTDVDVD